MSVDTLGFLLQGVSQQQPKVRTLGEVGESVNFHPDVVEGLTTRPPTVQIAAIPVIPDTAESVTVEVADVPFRLVFQDGLAPRVFNYAGQELTVTSSPGSADYMAADTAVYVWDRDVYIANRNKVVEMQPAPAASILTGWGFIFCLGAQLARPYLVTLMFGAVEVRADFRTTSDPGSSEDLSSGNMAATIKTQLESALTAAGITTVTITRSEGYLSIMDTDNSLTDIKVNDGDGGTTIKGGVTSIRDLTELPKYAPNGAYLRIVGEPGSDKDDFWMRYSVPGQALWGGFGQVGMWEEWYDVSEPAYFNPATMPHKLVITSPTTATFSQETWWHRRVGNEEGNPTPSFVGATIRDILEFQGRLTFATSVGTVVQSRSKEPRDFFVKSSVTGNVSDPIDVSNKTEGSTTLEWMMPLDKDLFVLSRSAQFVIGGGTANTPDTAAMNLATKYTMSVVARPGSTGRTILLPYFSARYSRINEYFARESFETNMADDLNKKTAKYVDGQILDIIVAETEGLVAVRTDKYREGWLWTYKYIWENDTKVQSAWSKWKFPGPVKHMYTSRGQIYFWVEIGDTVEGVYYPKEEVLCSMRLDLQPVMDMDYRVCGDLLVKSSTVNPDNITVDTPYANAVFVFSSDSPDAPHGAEIVPDITTVTGSGSSARYRHTFDTLTRPWLLDGEVINGTTMDCYVDPTEFVPRNPRTGEPRSDVVAIVNNYYVDFANSGPMQVVMVSKYRGTPVMADTDWLPLDDDPDAEWSATVRSGTLTAPWGERASLAKLRIKSSGARPVSILELRAEAQLLKEGG